MACIMYSLELSAAFDMLRMDIFERILNRDIPKNLMGVLMDFLSNRTCITEVNNVKTSLKEVPLGCVQGSVLGPKLFNVYTSKIPSLLGQNARIVS